MRDTRTELSREEIIDILKYIGVTKIIDHGKDNIQYCCPIHGESTPSMGYSMRKGLCNCFSCHFSGSIEWLVYKALPEEFKNTHEVQEWILSKYNVDLREDEKLFGRTLRRYGIEIQEEEEVKPKERWVLPKSFIAPFKSGKETYKYFFDRGFTKQTMVEYMIGRDTFKKTVTIPVFHRDGVLTGVIGRYIDPNRPKNSRYAVYEFPKGSTLYPIHKFEPRVVRGKRVLVLVEGILDSLWLHQNGHREALSILGNGLSKDQAELVKSLDVDTIVLAYDNDKGGTKAVETTRKHLGDNFTYKQVKYPRNCKDAQEMNREQIDTMLNEAIEGRRKFKRR